MSNVRFSFRAIILSAALLFSAVAVGAGFKRAWEFEKTPGQSAHSQAQWPVGCALSRQPGQAILVMAVHPECPCSRASLNELAQLMTHCQGKLQAYVLFVRPLNFRDDWSSRDLWNAAALSGVTRIVDDQDMAWHDFGARTSGQVFLYDASGRLRFLGGITESRGHDGDNVGRGAIESFLMKGTLPTDWAPVFGCALK